MNHNESAKLRKSFAPLEIRRLLKRLPTRLWRGGFLTGFAIFLVVTVIFGFYQKIQADTKSAEELKNSLNQKSQELNDIGNQIKETQKQLESTQNQKGSLQNELSQINYGMKQLDLGIKSSGVLINKYGLEIDQLQGDISDSETKINTGKEAIAEALRKLQQQTGVNGPLEIFLKNKDISESVFQIQGLLDIQEQLSKDVSDLNVLKGELSNDLDAVSNKKVSKEAENENLKNKKVIAEETKKDKQQFLAQTKNKEQTYQKYLTDLQKKQAEIAAEIEKIDAELRKRINPADLPLAQSGVLTFPIGNGAQLTQGYGATQFASINYRGKWHNGIDYGAPLGTPIFAAEKGIVAAVGNQDKYCYKAAYGKFITIRHDNNLVSLYAHLSLQIVKENERVERGQLIGYSGMSGWATGPHLHFTIFAGPTFSMRQSRFCGPMPSGGDLNPLNYL